MAEETELGAAAERDRLARLLRETRLQLTMTQARLNALEQSATLELGRTIVRAAKKPWPRGAQLPRDLYRMWRSGGTGSTAQRTSPAQLALASAQLSDLAGGGERMLSALTAPGLSAQDQGLSVTGVLTARATATLAPDAAVQPLLPHNADVLLESAGADLVLIEAAAMLSGSPWAYAVDPAGADRGRRLGRLIAGARALGKPVIFVRNVPLHLAPGLDWVAASCDAVWDEGLGVQLSLFNPAGAPRSRGLEPMYAGARTPREAPAIAALLDAVTRDGGPVAVSGDIQWRRLPALYRSHALFVTADPGQGREQAACGARVVTTEPGDDASGLLLRISAAVGQGPLSRAELLAGLRAVFETDATPAVLGQLANVAGLPGGLVSGRQIAVLARASGPDEAREIADQVLRQRLRPAELVVCATPVNSAEDELGCRAIAAALQTEADSFQVRVTPAAAAGSWVAAAAASARSPWAAPWPGSPGIADTYLLDLACARECSGADAVGQEGQFYQFTTSLEPGLARTDLLASRTGRLELSHGSRLFSAS
jgi:hypothetical protein